MIKVGDKVYHFQSMNRIGILSEIKMVKNNQMTVGGTTDTRRFYVIYYPDTQTYETHLSGDIQKHFE